jgi:hypothetical protein
MTHAHGTHLGGIRALDDLMQRCVVDRETGCWHLRTARGRPMPAHRVHRVWFDGASLSAVRVALTLRGVEIPVGSVGYRCCSSYDCVLHLGVRTRVEHGAAVGLGHVAVKTAANRKAGAARSRVSSHDRARIAYGGETVSAVARALGISQSWAWTIKQRELCKTIGELPRNPRVLEV